MCAGPCYLTETQVEFDYRVKYAKAGCYPAATGRGMIVSLEP
jgi:hypothetical protein